MSEGDLKDIESKALLEISNSSTTNEAENIRVKYLGRSGLITKIIKELGSLPADEKPRAGSIVNALKEKISIEIESRLKSLSKVEAPAEDTIDITLPGIVHETGSIHPVAQVIREICDIFSQMGFRIVDGPEIDTEYYNFEVLNIPLEHPSRDAFDTFYIRKNILLRSQTSNLQGRIMEKEKPPLRILAPGRVYRPDAIDASHSFMFHQIEGFMVDRDVRFSDLKGVLEVFLKKVFGEKIKTRFIPHYFPFTEPSAEVEISCVLCSGEPRRGCPICKGGGWLEVLGSGMINPRVFKMVGYDTHKWTGFAFGMGVERIAMLKYGIDDIRLFFENDLRFLEQF
ncbi:MAG: phenylalanine--tRNA ligase subunit alpha [Candidatus Omnitrophica bacterium]|nr:phenylalanine--tRNA ligase subunit alpha [Candidatus Omnitrophota bacterium]